MGYFEDWDQVEPEMGGLCEKNFEVVIFRPFFIILTLSVCDGLKNLLSTDNVYYSGFNNLEMLTSYQSVFL